MKRFIEGDDRTQSTLFPAPLDEYVDEGNLVRVIDVFVDALDFGELGFNGVVPEATGRPSYHPSVLLKIYVYGYLNRTTSSRRQERETQRNIEMMRLTGRLMPDFKTIANLPWRIPRRCVGWALSSWCCAETWICSRMRWRRSTAASSRQ